MNVREAFLFALIAFAGIGGDAAVGAFQMLAPFAFAVFVVDVSHEDLLVKRVRARP